MNNLALTSENLTKFAIAFIPALFGIVCHEVAHGWVAWKHGDPSAKALGRLTLNPLKHLDVTGTGVFVLSALFSPFVIGWAKPVPVNARHFKDPRRGMLLVSLAGPVANFLVAILCAIIGKIILLLSVKGLLPAHRFFGLMLESASIGIYINCGLAFFNLLPIPPLDGSHVLSYFLPRELAIKYESIGRYGMIILIFLLAFKVFSRVLGPLVETVGGFIFSLMF